MPRRKHLFIIFLLALSQFIRAGGAADNAEKNIPAKAEKMRSVKNDMEGRTGFDKLMK
jgi:hypothetical protein